MLGNKYCNWTVIDITEKGLKCKCNCGHEEFKKIGYLNYISKNNSRSGCRKCNQGTKAKQAASILVSGLVNKQVGDWTILKFVGKNKYNSRMWLCRCKCGNERTFGTAYLSGNGKRHATQCKNCELLEMEEQNRLVAEIPDRFWSKFIHTASRRGIGVSLTKEQAQEKFNLQNGHCALTGKQIWFTKLTTNYSRYTTASMDRIDSSKPYTMGNIQWVDKRVNMMKQQYSQKEFIELCKSVASYN